MIVRANWDVRSYHIRLDLNWMSLADRCTTKEVETLMFKTQNETIA